MMHRARIGHSTHAARLGCAACICTLLLSLAHSQVGAAQRQLRERDLIVFAASSLGDVLHEASDVYSQVAPDVRILLHLAGSTALARQIAAGAPADVFLCADVSDMRWLRAQGIALEPRLFATNRLVVAAASSAPALRSPRALADTTVLRIAVGNPLAAPVGRYTRQAFDALKLSAHLEPRLLPCENARHITSALASGACDLAVAYRTDVLAEQRLRVVWTFADSLHAPIGYFVTPLRRARQLEDAASFARFVASDTLAAILARHGFVPASTQHGVETAGTLQRAASPAATRRRSRLQPLWLSLRIAALATLCSGALGLGIGASLARGRAGLRRDLLAALTDLPLVMPPTVIGLALLELCGPHGLVGALLERVGGVRLTFTWAAAVLASAVMALPLMVRTARAALESVPERYVEAARTLGATPWSAFWRVQLPLARRGVVAGVVLCFFRALGEFGATLMVAGNIPGRTQTLPLAIYTAVFEGRPHDAALWVVWVLALSGGGALAAQRLSRTEAAP
jgi:molybdate transport system permease protein